MLVVAVVAAVGQAGHVGVVEVDVGGLGRLPVGVAVVVVVAAVVVMVVVVVVVVWVGRPVAVVVLGHGTGTAQAAHRLIHVGVVGRRLHLQGPLGGIGLVARRSATVVAHVVDMVAEEAAVALRRKAQGQKVSLQAHRSFQNTPEPLHLCLSWQGSLICCDCSTNLMARTEAVKVGLMAYGICVNLMKRQPCSFISTELSSTEPENNSNKKCQ